MGFHENTEELLDLVTPELIVKADENPETLLMKEKRALELALFLGNMACQTDMAQRV